MAEPKKEPQSEKTIKFGEIVLQITDPHNIQPVSADLYTESRFYNGIICLSFAHIVADGSSAPEARISARIRLTVAGAADLRNALDNLLNPPQPPKGQVN